MSQTIPRREFTKGLVDQALREAFDRAIGAKSRRAFAHLLWNVQSRSDLLRPSRFVGRAGQEALKRLALGLLALVECRRDWLRPVEEWEPRGAGPIPTFSSLAHHLTARYPVPPVLLSAWFRQDCWRGNRLRYWFRHIGKGGSLRGSPAPVHLTRRMVQEFWLAPPHVPIEFALCWARVRGLGGSDELARAVASTRLGKALHLGGFWTSLIHLFLNSPRLDLSHVEPIVDYLCDQKFEHRTVVIGEDTEVALDPPRPDLSIKGCTVSSLLRRAEEWRASRRPTAPQRRVFRWDRSPIGEFRLDRDDGLSWTIRELLDSDSLAAEGKAMRHCVATYTASCLRRSSTIWSLGEEGPGGRRRVLTIEVDPERREVVQASMKCNNDPDEPSMAVLREWVAREGLTLDW